MLALVDTVPTSCVFVCDAFYDTLNQSSNPADEMAPDDPGAVGSFSPLLEGENERGGTETRENKRLAAHPREKSKDGEQQPCIEACPELAT